MDTERKGPAAGNGEALIRSATENSLPCCGDQPSAPGFDARPILMELGGAVLGTAGRLASSAWTRVEHGPFDRDVVATASAEAVTSLAHTAMASGAELGGIRAELAGINAGIRELNRTLAQLVKAAGIGGAE